MRPRSRQCYVVAVAIWQPLHLAWWHLHLAVVASPACLFNGTSCRQQELSVKLHRWYCRRCCRCAARPLRAIQQAGRRLPALECKHCVRHNPRHVAVCSRWVQLNKVSKELACGALHKAQAAAAGSAVRLGLL